MHRVSQSCRERQRAAPAVARRGDFLSRTIKAARRFFPRRARLFRAAGGRATFLRRTFRVTRRTDGREPAEPHAAVLAADAGAELLLPLLPAADSERGMICGSQMVCRLPCLRPTSAQMCNQ